MTGFVSFADHQAQGIPKSAGSEHKRGLSVSVWLSEAVASPLGSILSKTTDSDCGTISLDCIRKEVKWLDLLPEKRRAMFVRANSTE